MDRTQKILRHVERSNKVLEIGPSYSPIVRRSDGWNCFSLDRMSADELRDAYRNHAVDISRIEPVDFVWKDGPMEGAVPAHHHGTFDVCIASHVIEHIPNLIEFFRSMAVLLKDHGKISLAIPDKRFCFDYFQPVTLTGDVLDAARLDRTRYAKRTVFNSNAYSTTADGAIAWTQEPPGRLALVGTSLEAAKAAFDLYDEAASSQHEDHHCMYFTPSSFDLLMTELSHLALVDFRIVDLLPPQGCEFFATLARGRAQPLSDSALGQRRLALLESALLESREQTDYFLKSDNASAAERRVTDEGSARRLRADVHDRYVSSAPDPQFAVDLVPGWVSALPATIPVKAGNLPLYQDPRVTWGLAELGGAWNQTVLELGPLEAGHTYMLEQAGAASITCIEANTLCYVKCLIAKELLGLGRARFLLGDFVRWMQTERKRFDIVFASGVLYHQAAPVEFLELLAQKGDKLFLWTHYVPDEGYSPDAPWASPIVGVEQYSANGRRIPVYRRAYGSGAANASFCGGVQANPAWLRRSDILDELKRVGFGDLRVGHEDPDHPNGPCFAIAALR